MACSGPGQRLFSSSPEASPLALDHPSGTRRLRDVLDRAGYDEARATVRRQGSPLAPAALPESVRTRPVSLSWMPEKLATKMSSPRCVPGCNRQEPGGLGGEKSEKSALMPMATPCRITTYIG